MIVLAITGLLIVMVLVTYNHAQIRRRNAQREVDLHLIMDNIEKFKNSPYSGGVYPKNDATFLSYFDPTGSKGNLGFALNHNDPLSHTPYRYIPFHPYAFVSSEQPSSTAGASIMYGPGTCSGSPAYPGVYWVTMSLEGAASEDACFDNH